jgi:hypothetical protein
LHQSLLAVLALQSHLQQLPKLLLQLLGHFPVSHMQSVPMMLPIMPLKLTVFSSRNLIIW